MPSAYSPSTLLSDMLRPHPVHLALGSCGGLKPWLHLPPGEQWCVKQPSQIASTTDVSIPHDCADVISIQTDATTLRGRPYSNVIYKCYPVPGCYRRHSSFFNPRCSVAWLCGLLRWYFLVVFSGYRVQPQRKAHPNGVCCHPHSLQPDAGNVTSN